MKGACVVYPCMPGLASLCLPSANGPLIAYAVRTEAAAQSQRVSLLNTSAKQMGKIVETNLDHLMMQGEMAKNAFSLAAKDQRSPQAELRLLETFQDHPLVSSSMLLELFPSEERIEQVRTSLGLNPAAVEPFPRGGLTVPRWDAKAEVMKEETASAIVTTTPLRELFLWNIAYYFTKPIAALHRSVVVDNEVKGSFPHYIPFAGSFSLALLFPVTPAPSNLTLCEFTPVAFSASSFETSRAAPYASPCYPEVLGLGSLAVTFQDITSTIKSEFITNDVRAQEYNNLRWWIVNEDTATLAGSSVLGERSPFQSSTTDFTTDKEVRVEYQEGVDDTDLPLFSMPIKVNNLKWTLYVRAGKGFHIDDLDTDVGLVLGLGIPLMSILPFAVVFVS